MKDKKSLIIYTQPKKGITVHTKRDTISIGLSIDERDKKDYFQDRIKELEKNNLKLKDALNSLSGRRDEITYLKKFRDLFSGYCVSANVKVTIIQCTERIKHDRCKKYENCQTRKSIIERLYLQDLNISY